MLALLAGGATMGREVEDAGVALEIAVSMTDPVVAAVGEGATV